MNILLINPNTYQNPPVIPLGLEYLASTLIRHKHPVDILDLCFEADPRAAVENLMKTRSYGLIGITLRNVDTVLYQNNESFLEPVKRLVSLLRRSGAPIVLGGSGFSIAPEAILSLCGGDFGVKGPGENALLHLTEDLKSAPGILDGWKYGFDPALAAQCGRFVDYAPYIRQGGIAGFETHKGCPHHCGYCVEAGTAVSYKSHEAVIREIADRVESGHRAFHLCDSEFNADLDQCGRFLRELIKRNLDMTWALYMAPVPYDENLFALLKQSHATLMTLSVCSDEREQRRMGYTCADLERIMGLCRKYAIKLAIDLLIGFPGEGLPSVERMIRFLKVHRPDSVGVNSYFRLYQNTSLTKDILESPEETARLSRPLRDNDDFLSPIFYHQLDLPAVRRLIRGDPLFKIEGFEKTVNYQRV